MIFCINHCNSSLKLVNMKKENLVTANAERSTFRVTRSRAMLPPKAPVNQDQKRNLRSNTKRAASDENSSIMSGPECLKKKRRKVLKDVSNISCENSCRNCIAAGKIQAKNYKQFKGGQVKVSKLVPSVEEILQLKTDEQTKMVLETGETKDVEKVETEDVDKVVCSTNVEENSPFQLNAEDGLREIRVAACQFEKQRFAVPCQPLSSSEKEKGGFYRKLILSSNPDVKDIDSDDRDPQLCSLYASEIYSNLHVAELIRRPCPKFMETIQRDVTDGMRRILVDWLVEVSEEYKLVPDTLFLTVYFIDLFLSQNNIERHRLQLLGITCMLIASKYEEICAPRVEEFCFITDSTYTREEVLKMETQVLNYFAFQLSAPTTKTFLRRFLRAAQATYMNPCLELEYLANYLAELTLMEYSFLNYLPSVIAASAVFLAKWTLDQSGHPWNPTLEHYTGYAAPDLKTIASELQDLQLNTKDCPLIAIRAKYRQEKFKYVATLSSPTLPQTLFQTSKKADSF